MSGWLTALRIAWREARRARGRTALVVLLIGMPVLGLTFAAASYDTFRLSPTERADRDIGAGDALVSWDWREPVRQHPTEPYAVPVNATQAPRAATAAEVLAALPAGTRAIPLVAAMHGFRTAAGTATLQTTELDYADPLARGILVPLAGRAPAGPDEVALSPHAARRVGAGVGGTLHADKGGRSWRIVGLVEDPDELRRQVAVFRPGAFGPPARPEGIVVSEGVTRASDQESRYWIVDTPAPLPWAAVKKLNKTGVVALSRAVLLDPPPASEIPTELMPPEPAFPLWPMVGGMLVLEVVLLAGPAFAVGARRRRRELALVAAAGGTPAHLRRIVLAGGLVAGTVAALGGIAAGLVTAAAGQPLIEEYVAQSRPGAFRVYPAALASLAALAALAGLLAAMVPAWSASRQPVAAALSGRYAATRLRRRWAVAGALLLASGVVATVAGGSIPDNRLTTVGLVAGQLGLVLCTPALIGLISRLGGWLPLGPRIALRDIGRNRASAAPAVAAVLAAVSVSALLATLFAANRAQNLYTDLPTVLPEGYAAAGTDRTPTAESLGKMEAALRASLPVTAVVRYGATRCAKPGPTNCWAEADLPAPRRCPYALMGTDTLTPAQQRAARRDARCDRPDPYLRTSTGSMTPTVVIIDPADLRHLARLDPQVLADASRTLRAGGVVLDDPRLVVDGQVTMLVHERRADERIEIGPDGKQVEPPGRPVRLPAYVLPYTESPSRILSPATVDRLGLAAEPAGLVAATGRAPTEAEQDRLSAAVSAVGGGWAAGVESRPHPADDPYLLLLSIGAGLITLGAAAIATGLAAADGRADLTTLAAIGASPGVRRVLSLSQTGLIAGLGSVLGVVAGMGAAGAMIFGINQATAHLWPAPPVMPFLVPWANVLIALVVVPAVAILGAGLLTRSRLPVERRL